LPRDIDLLDPEPATEVVPGEAGGFDVTVRTAAPALWAWLELCGTEARYSDHFICIRPGAPATIHVRPAAPMTVEQCRARLRVRSLWETYQAGA